MKVQISTKIWIFILVVLLSFGGLGGSFQPTRLLLIIFFLFTLKNISVSKLNLKSSISIGTSLYVFWILYGIISLLWSTSPIKGLKSELIVMTIGMLALPIFDYYQSNPKLSITIRNAWITGATIVTILGVYEIITGNHFESQEEYILGGIGLEVPHANVFFGNHNNYCAYIAICFPFILSGFIEQRKKIFAFFFLVLLLLSASTVIVNASRTGVLVIIIQIFYFSIAYYKRLLKNSFWIILGVIVLYFYFPWEDLFFVLKYRTENMTQDARSVMVSAGLEMLTNSYGFGVGAGAFEDYALPLNSFDHIINPHNLLIEILSQYGVIIFLTFILWLVHIFVKTFKSDIPKTNKVTIQSLILTIPLIGVMNSDALGYTYWWVMFASISVMSNTKRFNKDFFNYI